MRRIPQLDGLRAIAILMVFATHAFRIPLLWMGVDLFFVLSGYLITGILLRLKEQRSTGAAYWKPFYFRRIRRIIPAYVAFLVFISLFFSIPWASLWYWYVFFGANLALAFGKVQVAALSPLWSLAVEEQFYFIWPCVVLLCTKKALRRVALAVVIASPFLRGMFTPLFTTHFPIYSLTIFRADTLAAGAFIALSESGDLQWIQRHRREALTGAISTLGLLGLLSLVPSFRTGANSILFNSVGYSLSVALCGGTLIYALGVPQGFLRAILTYRPLRFLGQISYTFYLYQVAILYKLEEHIHSSLLTAVLTFILTCAIAAASWRFFESPILNGSRVQPKSAQT